MSRLLIVSNRLPLTLRIEKGGVASSPSSGGLATAMKGPHEQMDSLWIGWPGDVSRASADQRKEIDATLARSRTVPVHLSASEVSRYYDGFSNAVLWPLFHYLIDKVHLDAQRDWEVYRAVNEKFADVVAQQYRSGDRIWVHDYQLALVPRMLRQRIPDARIGYFLHIPFPSSEIFSLLPWREPILRGMLGADLVGFHTASYRRNFAFSVERLLGFEPGEESLRMDHREVRLGVHGIGVDTKSFDAMARTPEVEKQVEEIRASAPGRTIVVGVDRLDYTKGIPRRLLAIERLLERSPERRKTMRYFQLAVPTRERVDTYAEFRKTVNELVGRINGQYGSVESVPIHLLHRSVSMDRLVALYRAADVMLVTPLRDGMNLVAKEYVATRYDDTGVLVLSEFAGAADELREAMLVNPYDVEHVADAIDHAMTMPADEKRWRMNALRTRVTENDVHLWAGRFLEQLGEVAMKPSTPSLVGESERSIVERLQNAPALELFLDYDGTLVPLARRPEDAQPDDDLRDLLTKLAARPHTRVHIVSGRPRADLEAFFGALPVVLHAEHGFWRREVGGAWKQARDASLEWIAPVRKIMHEFASRTPGVRIEEKSSALAWHYRLADPELARKRLEAMRAALQEVVKTHDLELLPGAKVLEVRMHGVNKGASARALLQSAERGAEVLALGDDRTDEDLFAALGDAAITLHVGEGPTRAGHRLPSHREARRLLRALVA